MARFLKYLLLRILVDDEFTVCRTNTCHGDTYFFLLPPSRPFFLLKYTQRAGDSGVILR